MHVENISIAGTSSTSHALQRGRRRLPSDWLCAQAARNRPAMAHQGPNRIECRAKTPVYRETRRQQGANMCDQDHFEKDQQDYEALGLVTRRQFGVMLGAGVAMMLPQVKNAVKVTESDVNIMTPDGTAD